MNLESQCRERLILDDVDRAILAVLQEDALLPRRAIARAVGVSVETLRRRIERLHESGYLIAYRASVAPEAFGIGAHVLCMTRLHRHDRSHIDAFERAMLEVPEVCECHRLAGPTEYAFRLAVDDPEHLRSLLTAGLGAASEVARIETLLILDVVKPNMGWPVGNHKN
jgi:Lrp/AsnC family transcriptional regulator, leucine-responsive regulatory protein